MGSVRRNLHNDRVKMTEVKMKTQSPQNQREDEMMTSSKAAAPQARSASHASTKRSSRKQQQTGIQELPDGLTLDGQEHCDEFSTKMRILSTNSSYQRKFGWGSGVTEELRYLPTSSSGVCFWVCAHLANRASFISATDSFFFSGVMTPTLLLVRPGLH